MDAPTASEFAGTVRVRRSAFPRTLVRLAASALALTAALGIAEVAVRSTSFRQTAWDPDFGWIPSPGSEVRWSREGHARSRWTDHGIRRASALPPTSPPPILVLGDSFTEAYQVDDDAVFTSIAEEALRKAGNPLVLLNAGRSDRSPADYVALAPLYRITFRPRWTVIQVTDADFEGDAWKSGKTHLSRDARTGELRVVPVETKGPNGELRWKIYNELANRIALIPWTLDRLGAFRQGTRHEPPLFSAGDVRPQAAEPGPGTDPELAAELALLRASYDGRVTLLFLSSFDPERPLATTRTEREVALSAGTLGLGLVSTRLENSRSLARGRAPYGFSNSGFNEGHLNPAGHRAAGNVLALALRDLSNRGLL